MSKLRGAVAHDTSITARTLDVLLPESTTFADLLLDEKTLVGLHSAGFCKPSPIQLASIPIGRLGRDLIVHAKSGTGKTLVFGIIALEMLDLSISRPQVLILAPTREIAAQIKEVISTIAIGYAGLKVDVFIGGLSVERDVAEAKGCHVVVGTPGRIKQLVSEKALDLSAVRLFVLDEADRLVETSFRKDVGYIFSRLPDTKQTLVVSATFPPIMEAFLSKFLVSPKRVSPSEDQLLLGLRQFGLVTLAHTSPLVQVQNKVKALLNIITTLPFRQCLVFCNFQSRMEGICRDLASRGWPALYLSSSLPQTQRLETVAALQTQRCRVLLSTDLASRGVDAEQVDLVVNLDLPYDTPTFLHRIGRAGRFGAPGIAVTVVSAGEEVAKFQNILHDVGGPSYQVLKLPESTFSEQVWLPEAELDVIESLKREEEEIQLIKESPDEELTVEEAAELLSSCFLVPSVDMEVPSYNEIVNLVDNKTYKLDSNVKFDCDSTTFSNEKLVRAIKGLRLSESFDLNSSKSSSVELDLNAWEVPMIVNQSFEKEEDISADEDDPEISSDESCAAELDADEFLGSECYETEDSADDEEVEEDSADEEVEGDSADDEEDSQDCDTCSSWFSDWKEQLNLQRAMRQSQIYMEEMVKAQSQFTS